MRAYHDSANYKYRRPLGALVPHEKLRLAIRLLEADIESVYLRLCGDGLEETLPLLKEGSIWFAEMDTPAEPGAYFYYFIINSACGTAYYCGDYKLHAGEGALYSAPSGAFQLTVYDPSFTAPDWMKNAVMYQIFPDRYKRGDPENIKKGYAYHTGLGRKVYLHKNESEAPDYLPREEGGHYEPNDFFGGDLKGITDSLDYLAALGVDVIYLNPIFESVSNHRYDTADYMKIDPFLGDASDFSRLASEAAGRGIRLILDGVFSHTGADSRYFDKFSRYEQVGAHENPESEYYSWYTFYQYPESYKAWWGFPSLPEVNENDPSWQEFVITGEDSVISHWLREGAAGFRLDVADELPDNVIELMRAEVKKRGGALIGEVWEDATTKESYGNQRKYAFGRALDSIMNYPLRNAVVDFLLARTSARELALVMLSQWQNYPPPMYYSLMNLLSSHDIPRILTSLTAPVSEHEMSREQQACYAATSAAREHASLLCRLASAIIFALPGMPSVYYGDETGMEGMLDPFDRGFFALKDAEMLAHYRLLSKLRHRYPELTSGGVSFRTVGEDIFALVRYLEGEVVLLFVNRSEANRRMLFDILGTDECMTDEDKSAIANKKYTRAKSLLTDNQYPVESELLSLELLPYSFDLLKLL